MILGGYTTRGGGRGGGGVEFETTFCRVNFYSAVGVHFSSTIYFSVTWRCSAIRERESSASLTHFIFDDTGVLGLC